ncbi:PQQ-binding-like beta-propeller repeat protein [Micromonospora sp. NPDC047527]|uniref:outer membrane protein assembly factor BamB family protein n=1 Tax=unclassified Micromonospora TaxID=2617518 RepID=UPI0033E1725A
MTGPVIDLGELRHGPDPDLPPRPPRAGDRRLRGALVLLLVLVTVAAAAVPPPPRTLVTLPARLGSDVLVDGDLFLVVEPTDTSARLAAYRLPGGAPAWQAPLSPRARQWGITPLGGTLLVTGYEIGPVGRETRTVALDRATGAQRWEQSGRAITLADGNVLLHSGGEAESSVLRAVDPCCGTVRWQLPPTSAQISFRTSGRGVDRMVLNPVNAPVEVREASTGAVLASASLLPPDDGPLGLEVMDDLLLAVDRGSATVTAYGLDRLDRRWTRVTGPVEFAGGCGPVVCLRTAAEELQALDPATGGLRWRSDRWLWGWPYGDRLMVSGSEAGPVKQYLVIDALTGEELADLGRWELYQLGPDHRMVGLRRHPDGGLLVGELDIRAGKVRVLDVLPRATGDCQPIPDRLLCAIPNSTYQLWGMSG